MACDVWLSHLISLTLSFLLCALCIIIETCPSSLFRKNIIKVVALWHHLQTHSTYRNPEHEHYASHMSKRNIKQSPKGSSLEVPPAMRRHFRAPVSAVMTSFSGHQAHPGHLLFPSTSFEVWLITADACSLMFYCLISRSLSLAIRRTIQTSCCSPLKTRRAWGGRFWPTPGPQRLCCWPLQRTSQVPSWPGTHWPPVPKKWTSLTHTECILNLEF